MSEQKIVTEKRGHVLLIGFNRPQKYNAFDLEMFMQLADAYGQLDGSLFYKIDDNLTFGLEAENLTNAKYTQFMTQTSGNLGRAWFVTGPRYTARLNYVF